MNLETAIAEKGLANLARQLNVSMQRLHGWRTRGIPLEHVPLVEAATGVPRESLRPDVDWEAFCRRATKSA